MRPKQGPLLLWCLVKCVLLLHESEHHSTCLSGRGERKDSSGGRHYDDPPRSGPPVVDPQVLVSKGRRRGPHLVSGRSRVLSTLHSVCPYRSPITPVTYRVFTEGYLHVPWQGTCVTRTSYTHPDGDDPHLSFRTSLSRHGRHPRPDPKE